MNQEWKELEDICTWSGPNEISKMPLKFVKRSRNLANALFLPLWIIFFFLLSSESTLEIARVDSLDSKEVDRIASSEHGPRQALAILAPKFKISVRFWIFYQSEIYTYNGWYFTKFFLKSRFFVTSANSNY